MENELVIRRGDKSKVVYEVIEKRDSLWRVRPRGEEDEWHAVWFKPQDLLYYVEATGKEARMCDASCVSAPVPLLCNDDPGNWARTVDYLNAHGFKLGVDCREDGIAQAEAEYITWTNGDTLAPSALHHYENKPLAREWRLRFKLNGEPLTCPFPVEIAGTGPQRPTKNPRGLLDSNNNVCVCFAEIVEKLVRAGLRS
jgi:hypothetical protein